MRRRHSFLDDDNFLTDWDDLSGIDCDIDSLAATLDFSLDTDGLDFAIDPDSYDFSLDGLNDFD